MYRMPGREPRTVPPTSAVAWSSIVFSTASSCALVLHVVGRATVAWNQPVLVPAVATMPDSSWLPYETSL